MDRRMFVAGMLAVVVACNGGSEPKPTPAPASTRPASTGHIKIVQPTAGEVVRGSTYLVKVQVTGARLLKEASTDVRPDTGHVHLFLDSKTVTLLAGLEFELKDLKPGGHVLMAELSASDHGFFNPRVIDTVTFTVE